MSTLPLLAGTDGTGLPEVIGRLRTPLLAGTGLPEVIGHLGPGVLGLGIPLPGGALPRGVLLGVGVQMLAGDFLLEPEVF